MTTFRCRPVSLILPVLVALAGCIHLQPAARAPSAAALVLEGVPPTEFGAQNCGAASLSAVLTYWGQPISVDELDAALPKADNGGVLSLDMALAARERGFSAELAVGNVELIEQSIAAGRPLILMLQVVDLVGQGHDLYHYVIVDGIDRGKELVRVQYGDGKARWVSVERVIGSWEDTGYATILVSPRAGTATAANPVLYAVALEEAGLLAEAEAIYRHLLETEPRSALLWVNLGNVLHARGLEDEAEIAFRRALDLDPMQLDALNNLAWLLLESGGDLAEAQQLVSRAVALGGPDPYLALDTMGRVLLRLGHCEDAQRVFELALESAPGGSTARGWILYGLALAQRDCGQPEAAVRLLESLLQETSDAHLRATAGSVLRSLSRR